MPVPKHTRSVKLQVDYRKISVEQLSERIFLHNPRVFGFSHRSLSSLRHPRLPLVLECLKWTANKEKKNVSALLDMFQASAIDADKWERAATVFDKKMDAPVFDKPRQQLILSREIIQQLEILWCFLVDGKSSAITEDVYKIFHNSLYTYFLGVDEVSVQTAWLSSVNADFLWDCRNGRDVNFEAFCLSMLELADNWTLSREPEDFIAFLKDIVSFTVLPRKPSGLDSRYSFSLNNGIFFLGG
ncbi:unnamed protein product [Phytomonas sp. EM1]|nr:unnamed protein product [Phytomonas sp. EM1]|eukprot:CCW62720.1 unnamed protein product [Phytomonas sp. isolate EM1]